MQLFIVSRDPVKCAQYLDNARVVKIPTEAAQMLSTTIRLIDDRVAQKHGLYKAFNPNHPVVKWVRWSRENWLWTWQYQQALCDEYEIRYGRVHKTKRMFDPDLVKRLSLMIPSKRFKTPANAARNKQHALDFTHIKPVYKAYRDYLKARWLLECERDRHPFAWLSSERPKQLRKFHDSKRCDRNKVPQSFERSA